MDGDYTEEESEELEFDDDVPAHRRMTVTRVTDHAELADSVLSAQSAPTINLTPMQMDSVASNHAHGGHHQLPTIKIEQKAQ